MSNPMTQEPLSEPRLPVGMGHAFAFQVFNSVSYIIVLSTPTVLWFKQWGASATELGVVAALCPLLNFLQVPGARHLEHVSYRKFVITGWTARAFSILGMIVAAALPITTPLAARLVVMFVSLLAFNGIRGWYACGFLPWMTALTPEKLRGRYLSGDQMSTAVATVATMVATALFLGTMHSRFNFAWVFAGSFVTAIVSVFFLRRIPDVPTPVVGTTSGRVPWKEMLRYPPFRKLVIFNAVANTAFAASSVFWVPLVRDQYGGSNSTMLTMMALFNLALIFTLMGFGRLVDRVGSRPLLGVALGVFSLHFLCWGGLAARVLPFNWTILVIIQGTAGVASSLYTLANMRLLMGTVPKMGRSHFFAMILVINGLLLGTLPVLWGYGLDRLAGWHVNWGPWEWNGFSGMYTILAMIMVVGQFFRRRIPEPQAMSTEAFLQELLVNTTSRALARLGLRRPIE